VKKIAELKITEMNTNDLEAAKRTVRGTARSMGIDIG
jgi:large subunit ribosomal protein L11